ncbi:transcriptional regulator [Micromonospora zingiberis]|uniref:Transcriptional regulator n=1 Tax=Micromonospora zingiberis TaxID=2053011 RepID=A0A4R0GX83_9ACTN|nr:transcriptional regulator [Micromonospora zingiberis]
MARALTVIGERWALLVVRELLLGPKRYADLTRGLPGISQNVLAQRLRDLEAAGLLVRRSLGPPVSARVYQLTDRGHQLDEVLLALGRWGSRQPEPAVGGLSADALMLALRTMYDPHRAAGLRTRVGLTVGVDRFVAEVAPAGLTVSRDTDGPCPTVIDVDVDTLPEVVFGGRAPADAEAAGALRITGDRMAAHRFLGSFTRPAGGDTDATSGRVAFGA